MVPVVCKYIELQLMTVFCAAKSQNPSTHLANRDSFEGLYNFLMVYMNFECAFIKRRCVCDSEEVFKVYFLRKSNEDPFGRETGTLE